MNAEWIDTTLGEFAPFIYGKGLPEAIRTQGKYKVYGSGGIVGTHIKPYVEKSGIVIGRKGTIGSVFLSYEGFWPIDTVYYIEDAPEKRDLHFTYYLLKILNLSRMNNDSAVPGLNRDQAHSLKIRIPKEIKVQKEISAYLKILDDKIELNNQINETIKSLVKAIFKEWFIDFGPVKAKNEGKKPLGMADETAIFFPDSFEESELGMIPKGWRVESYKNLLDSISETYKYAERTHIIFLNTSDILAGDFLINKLSEISSLPGQAKKKIRKGDILFSEIRPANKRYAYVDFETEAEAEDYVVSTKLMVLRSKNISSLFMYFVLTRDEVLNELQMYAESRSGTFPQITFENVKNLKIILPTPEILSSFVRVLEMLYTQQSFRISENKTLNQLRDILLPKLIPGELELKNK